VRKATLASILRHAAERASGVRLRAGTVFQHACRMGLEGIVSKRLGSRYRSGRTTDWPQVQEPGCTGGAARGGRGLGTMSCSGGRLCFRVRSDSSASLVHVRAMSFRMACTRRFGSFSAIFSHSAARILQSSEFNTGHPQKSGGRAKRERATVQREWRKNSSTPLRHPGLIMAEIWQGVGRVLDAIRSLLTMPLKLRPTGLSFHLQRQRPAHAWLDDAWVKSQQKKSFPTLHAVLAKG
jgi:hypothetical protein